MELYDCHILTDSIIRQLANNFNRIEVKLTVTKHHWLSRLYLYISFSTSNASEKTQLLRFPSRPRILIINKTITKETDYGFKTKFHITRLFWCWTFSHIITGRFLISEENVRDCSSRGLKILYSISYNGIYVCFRPFLLPGVIVGRMLT